MKLQMQLVLDAEMLVQASAAVERAAMVRNVEAQVAGKTIERARAAGWSGEWCGLRLTWLVETLEEFTPTGKRTAPWLPDKPLPERSIAFLCRAEMDY